MMLDAAPRPHPRLRRRPLPRSGRGESASGLQADHTEPGDKLIDKRRRHVRAQRRGGRKDREFPMSTTAPTPPIKSYYENYWSTGKQVYSGSNQGYAANFRRWMAEELRDLPAGAPILEVGCGDGAFTTELAKYSSFVTALDLSASQIEENRRRFPGIAFAQHDVAEPLPFPDADRLVMISSGGPGPNPSYDYVSGADVLDWRAAEQDFDGIGAMGRSVRRIMQAEASESVLVASVTANFFATIGWPVVAGRLPDRGDEPGGLAAVMRQRGWRRLFNGDPATVGRTVTLDARPATIVGVLETVDGLHDALWVCAAICVVGAAACWVVLRDLAFDEQASPASEPLAAEPAVELVA